MQCFGSVLVRLTEPLGSAEPPNLTEPLSSAEPVPERFGLPLVKRMSYFVYRNFEVGFVDVIALSDHFECCAVTNIITFHKIHPLDFDTSRG